MKNMNEEQKRLKNQAAAKFFLENKIPVHVSTNNGSYWNGLILEVGSLFFIMKDREKGHLVVFFNELNKPLEEFKEDRK